MKINNYKLKHNINIGDLKKLGFKEGSWLGEYEGVDVMSTDIGLISGIELHIAIRIDNMEFDDFDDILVLDSEFCQPYTPFYETCNYKKEVTNFKFLKKVIAQYNKTMDSLSIFEIF